MFICNATKVRNGLSNVLLLENTLKSIGRRSPHRSSPHASNELSLRLSISCSLTQASNAPQVTHDVLGLAEVNLLQEVAHLEFHVLDQSSNIGNVAIIVLDGEILLNLTCHVSAQVHLAQVTARSRQREDDG